MTTEIKFEFRPRWKEELACECALGCAVLDMTMGVDTVNAPSRQAWERRAPAWAAPLWQSFHDQLEAWCAARDIPLFPGSDLIYFELARESAGR